MTQKSTAGPDRPADLLTALDAFAAGRSVRRSPARLVIDVGDPPAIRRVVVTGFSAVEALDKLLDAGPRGVTSLDFPAGRRVSAAIYKLRREFELPISSTDEPHVARYGGQPVSGNHTRYRVESTVRRAAAEVAA